MSRPITAKINVSKILKEHLFAGKNGKYLDLTIWPNKNGAGQYGDTHFVCQSVSREAREAGVKGPIIGSLTMPDETPQQAKPSKYDRPPPKPQADDDDEIPF